jgi:hypothetical protein
MASNNSRNDPHHAIGMYAGMLGLLRSCVHVRWNVCLIAVTLAKISKWRTSLWINIGTHENKRVGLRWPSCGPDYAPSKNAAILISVENEHTVDSENATRHSAPIQKDVGVAALIKRRL